MEIKGSIESIIFRNAENGYTVAVVCAHGLMITAVGIFPPVTDGEEVTLVGDYKHNARFGDQFAVEQVIVAPPTSEENMIRYLSSGLFPGVGEVTASNIVHAFGKDTFDVIELNPSKLMEVRGVSKTKAHEIGEKYITSRHMQQTIVYLTQYHVSLNLAIRIWKAYENLTESIVRSNPYRMVEDVEGVGFRTADTIALAMGLAQDDGNRVRAALCHCLDDGANRLGHTYLPYGQLVNMCLKLLEFKKEQASIVMDVLENMEIMGEVMRIQHGEDKAGVMLASHYQRERSIALKLVQMMDTAPSYSFDYDKEIAYFEHLYDIALHEKQREAVASAMNNGGVVITGGPGTGKTTIIKCIIHLLERMGTIYALTAPTGRAAKRMNGATGRPAKTIHRLLEFNPQTKGFFVFNEHNKLPYDVVIVDEISMADEMIFGALLRALKPGARIILVGDKDQLPSVGAGCVLADVIASGIMPVVSLNHIYRQAEGSYIITNAHMINAGKLPEPVAGSKDFFFDYQEDETKMLADVLDFCTHRIGKFLPVSPAEIQVLAPLKKGLLGVNHINECLQEKLNPPSRLKNEMLMGESKLREGDRVIQTCNNYDVIWQRSVDGDVNSGEGVFNGDVGIIERIDKATPQLFVRFEDERVATYEADQMGDLALAYAISVHKSQGSEFRVVVVAVDQYNPMVLTKNLLYTAVTRAKEMVVLVGNKTTYAMMTHNKHTEKRYTALVQFIAEIRAEQMS